MKRFKRSYDFCLHYFQNIMDAHCEWEESQGVKYWQLKERVGLSQQYKDDFGLHSYKTSQIWNRIEKQYLKYFDAIMDEVYNGNKH